MAILFLATYVLEVSTNILFNVATKGSFSGKKILKTYYFWGDYSKKKNGGVQPKHLIVSYIIVTFIPFWASCFLKVSARVSLKVTTKASFRSKKTWKLSIFKAFFLKQNRRNASKKIEVSVINWALLYLGSEYNMELPSALLGPSSKK